MFRNGWFIAGCLAVLIAANCIVYREILAPGELYVAVLETEKGRIILAKSPSNKIVLIDTGPDAGVLRALGSALPMWRRDIEAIILTDVAGAGGLPAVLDRYRATILVRPREQGTRSQEVALAAALESEAGMRVITGDASLSMGDGVFVESSSSVIRISYGSTSFLVTNTHSLPMGSSAGSKTDIVISPMTVGAYVSNGTAVRDGS